MSSISSNLGSGVCTALNGSKKLTPGAFSKELSTCLDQACARVDEVDSNAKRLKDFALKSCRQAGRLLEQMKTGEIDAGPKGSLLPSQLEWKGHIQRACYSMFAAGALEGLQVARTGFGPRAYILPREMEAEKPQVFVELMGYSKSIHERAQWVTLQGETPKGSDRADLLKDSVQRRLDSDRDTPTKSVQGDLCWGHVNDLLSSAYESGAQTGLGHLSQSRPRIPSWS